MKKVLLTGSAGFVGTHVVEHILENTDWDIIGLDSFKHRGDSLRVNQLDHSKKYQKLDIEKRYRIVCHDLNAEITDKLIKNIGPVDYIINAASESHVDRSIHEPVDFVKNNVNLALNMLEYAKKVKPEKFIQVSTDEVFGPAEEGYSHHEWDRILPSNPYSASKAAQEAIAISYWRTYDVPVIITNTMNMFGERQDKEKYIAMLISKIINGETVTVHGNENYIGKRFYLHARNFADAIYFILKNVDVIKYEHGKNYIIVPERFNIVGEVELDNLELAKFVADLLGKKLKYELVDFHSSRPGHDMRYALDGTKIKERGWNQKINFTESIKKTIAWTIENEEWL